VEDQIMYKISIINNGGDTIQAIAEETMSASMNMDGAGTLNSISIERIK